MLEKNAQQIRIKQIEFTSHTLCIAIYARMQQMENTQIEK